MATVVMGPTAVWTTGWRGALLLARSAVANVVAQAHSADDWRAAAFDDVSGIRHERLDQAHAKACITRDEVVGHDSGLEVDADPIQGDDVVGDGACVRGNASTAVAFDGIVPDDASASIIAG